MRRDDGDKTKFVEFDNSPLPPYLHRKMALLVCGYAPDATVAQELMDVLGLEVS